MPGGPWGHDLTSGLVVQPQRLHLCLIWDELLRDGVVVAGPLLRCCCTCSPCLIAAAWSGSGHRGFRMLRRELGPCPPELNSMGQSERAPSHQSQERVGRDPGMQALLEAGEPRESHLASGPVARDTGFCRPTSPDQSPGCVFPHVCVTVDKMLNHALTFRFSSIKRLW